MVIRAFAKINLALEVGALRADGYHDLVSLFQSIDLADELEIEAADDLTLEVEGNAPAGADNLVLRAAHAVRELCGTKLGAKIRLSKHIPACGGLGGGSSDAAATLVGLDRLWNTRLSVEELYKIALHLGSDVPFFLLGGTALGMGRGEKLMPVAELPEHWVVLLFPGIAVSTATAFRALDAAREAGQGRASDAWRWPLLWDWSDGVWHGLTNDFEASVFALHPRLGHLRERLAASGAEHARMTGSGSTVFGLFREEGPAREAAASLAAEGVDTRVCRTLGRVGMGRR